MSVAAVVILAAGLGTRLGRPHPKPLTALADGRTILRQQLDHVRATFGDTVTTLVVVGFKKELIMEAAATEAVFVYNELFDQTNTAKSLLRALSLCPPGGVLWMNGDVVFDAGLLAYLAGETVHGSFLAVNTEDVAEEEIKYTLDRSGHVELLSKQVVGGLGEAVGINYLSASDRPLLERHLDLVEEQDYFEKAIEVAIADAGMRVRPVDISRFQAVEVDVEDDLRRANSMQSAEVAG